MGDDRVEGDKIEVNTPPPEPEPETAEAPQSGETSGDE